MYQVYLDDLELPLAPESIDTRINGNNKTVNLVNEGEINILKKAGLTDVSFDMRIPHYNLPYTTSLEKVQYYLNKLEILKTSIKPFQFIVIRDVLYNTNMKVSLEDYRINEKASDGALTKIDIKLKQYKDYGEIIGKVEEKQVEGKTVVTVKKEKERVVEKTTPKQYTVKKGDTLWAIAKKQLGEGSKYPELAKLNNILNPDIIRVGQVIRLV